MLSLEKNINGVLFDPVLVKRSKETRVIDTKKDPSSVLQHRGGSSVRDVKLTSTLQSPPFVAGSTNLIKDEYKCYYFEFIFKENNILIQGYFSNLFFSITIWF